MELLVLTLFIALILSLGMNAYVVFKLINQVSGGTTDFFIPNEPKIPTTSTEKNIPDSESLPLDQFEPNLTKPLKVKYTEDNSGNTMTELEEEENGR